MENEMATLVILTPGFPANEEDTTCLPSQQLFIKALNETYPGLAIVILGFEYPFFRRTYTWHGNTVISFEENKGKRRKLAARVEIWRMLLRLKREKKVVGIFSFWCGPCAFLGSWFGRLYGIAHYTWILGQDARETNRWVRWIRPRAGELVAMSDFLADEFYKNHAIRPGHIIPNGIDISLFGTEPVERDIDVLGAGSLIPLKQYDLFLTVVKRLRERMPSVKGMICGKGPEADRLHLLASTLQLGSSVCFAGELSHDRVLHAMRRAKVFLHTSNYEGFSTVCLEALYAGAQVISFCRPQKGPVANWHIVNTEEEMIAGAMTILQDPAPAYKSVLVYSMGEVAGRVMELFGYKK